MNPRRALISAAFLSALAAPSPAAAAEADRIPLSPLPNVRVGPVHGTRAFIALSLDRGRLRAYVCDGTLRRAPAIAKWFRGRWDGGSPLRLRGLRIDGVDGGGRVTGRVGGHAFSARPATMPAGLFDGRRHGIRATWIALSERRLRGNFVPTRPPRCRFVLVTSSTGQQQWVTVC
jgi:hypothetical protein